MSTSVLWGRRLDAAGLATVTPPFALYTNIEAKERIKEIDATTGLDDAITIINYAIKEAGVQSELLWWYDRAGLRGVVCPLPCSVQFFLLSPITQGLNYPC